MSACKATGGVPFNPFPALWWSVIKHGSRRRGELLATISEWALGALLPLRNKGTSFNLREQVRSILRLSVHAHAVFGHEQGRVADIRRETWADDCLSGSFTNR